MHGRPISRGLHDFWSQSTTFIHFLSLIYQTCSILLSWRQQQFFFLFSANCALQKCLHAGRTTLDMTSFDLGAFVFLRFHKPNPFRHDFEMLLWLSTTKRETGKSSTRTENSDTFIISLVFVISQDCMVVVILCLHSNASAWVCIRTKQEHEILLDWMAFWCQQQSSLGNPKASCLLCWPCYDTRPLNVSSRLVPFRGQLWPFSNRALSVLGIFQTWQASGRQDGIPRSAYAHHTTNSTAKGWLVQAIPSIEENHTNRATRQLPRTYHLSPSNRPTVYVLVC